MVLLYLNLLWQLLLCKSWWGKDIWRGSVFITRCARDNDLWYVEPFFVISSGRGYFGAVLTTWSGLWWDVMSLMFSFGHILFHFFKIIFYITLHNCRRSDMLKLINMALLFYIAWNMWFIWLYTGILSKYYTDENIARYLFKKCLIISTLLTSFLLKKIYSTELMWVKR